MTYDYRYPSWRNGGIGQEWKKYICQELQIIWETFTDEQKFIIAENASKLIKIEKHYNSILEVAE